MIATRCVCARAWLIRNASSRFVSVKTFSRFVPGISGSWGRTPVATNSRSYENSARSPVSVRVQSTRLREGTIDLLTVLQTQQTLFAAENALVQAQLARVQAVVSLYQALGGAWSPKLVGTLNAR